VEFCVKLPGRDAEAGHIWLPIDSKFPKEDYERLVDASQAGDQTQVEAAGTELERTVRKFAREVSEKYIHPPATTDFAILFMPSEGLYAEVLRRPGLAESLQREQRIVLAGPTNIVALLNSLQMGFRTLAIQKRSGEVWRVLGAVKTEFGKFGDVLDKLKKKLHQAGNDVENAKVRTRAMERRLRDVEALPEGESTGLLSLEDEGSAEHDGDEEPPEERRSV
jgi:DNA recombination protein RmuC